jgi:hypothetical protein
MQKLPLLERHVQVDVDLMRHKLRENRPNVEEFISACGQEGGFDDRIVVAVLLLIEFKTVYYSTLIWGVETSNSHRHSCLMRNVCVRSAVGWLGQRGGRGWRTGGLGRLCSIGSGRDVGVALRSRHQNHARPQMSRGNIWGGGEYEACRLGLSRDRG